MRNKGMRLTRVQGKILKEQSMLRISVRKDGHAKSAGLRRNTRQDGLSVFIFACFFARLARSCTPWLEVDDSTLDRVFVMLRIRWSSLDHTVH